MVIRIPNIACIDRTSPMDGHAQAFRSIQACARHGKGFAQHMDMIEVILAPGRRPQDVFQSFGIDPIRCFRGMGTKRGENVYAGQMVERAIQ